MAQISSFWANEQFTWRLAVFVLLIALCGHAYLPPCDTAIQVKQPEAASLSIVIALKSVPQPNTPTPAMPGVGLATCGHCHVLVLLTGSVIAPLLTVLISLVLLHQTVLQTYFAPATPPPRFSF